MTEILPCPLCASANVDVGFCFVGEKTDGEEAARCRDCGCRATKAAWQARIATEQAYANDEIAELEGLRASIKAIDDAPVERYRAALAVLRGDHAQPSQPSGDADLMAATAAITALAEHDIPVDIQEVLVRGDPSRGIKPNALLAATKATILSYHRSAPQAQPAQVVDQSEFQTLMIAEAHERYPQANGHSRPAFIAGAKWAKEILPSAPQASVEGSEPVAWRVLCTEAGATGYRYTEQLPFEPDATHPVRVRKEPEPLYTAPPSQTGMREALEPFAKVADLIECTTSHEYFDTDEWEVSIGDLRRARAALQSPSHSGQTNEVKND